MKKLILSGLLLLFSLTAQAQEVLTLEQCRSMALEHNKQMTAARRQTEASRYLLKSMKGNFFPNLSAYGTDVYASMDGSLNIPGGNLPVFLPTLSPTTPAGFAYFPGIDLNLKVKNVLMAGIQLEQPLYMGGKIRAGYRMAQAGSRVATLQEQLTASEVIWETENAYAQLVQAQELKKVAESYRALLEELLKVVESAQRHGLKPQNDVLKVRVKLNESELQVRKADHGCRLATMNLCHWTGQPLSTSLTIEPTYPYVPQLEDHPQGDIMNRPEYGMLSQQVEVAREQVKLERSEMLPQVGLRGSFDYTNGVKVNGQKLLNKPGFAVMLNVTLPLYHFGERHNKVKAAKMKLEQAQLEQANLNEKMQLELTQALHNLDEAQLENEIADRSLEQAAENLRLSKDEYEAGMEILSDYLEAQTLWQQAYATQVNARFALYLQYVKFLKATGQLVR